MRTPRRLRFLLIFFSSGPWPDSDDALHDRDALHAPSAHYCYSPTHMMRSKCSQPPTDGRSLGYEASAAPHGLPPDNISTATASTSPRKKRNTDMASMHLPAQPRRPSASEQNPRTSELPSLLSPRILGREASPVSVKTKLPNVAVVPVPVQ